MSKVHVQQIFLLETHHVHITGEHWRPVVHKLVMSLQTRSFLVYNSVKRTQGKLLNPQRATTALILGDNDKIVSLHFQMLMIFADGLLL